MVDSFWNRFLAISSIILWTLVFGVGLAWPVTFSSNIAATLAPQINVNEDVLRAQLYDILATNTVWRAFFVSSPLAIISILLVGTLVVGVARARKKSERCESAD
jgi:hypothetical protein